MTEKCVLKSEELTAEATAWETPVSEGETVKDRCWGTG